MWGYIVRGRDVVATKRTWRLLKSQIPKSSEFELNQKVCYFAVLICCCTAGVADSRSLLAAAWRKYTVQVLSQNGY